MSWGSLQERKKNFLEDCCGGGGMGGGDAGGMSVGDAGFQSAAPAEGPRAGYDPVLGRTLKRLRNNKKRRAEG
jgi:hypothetical protein